MPDERWGPVDVELVALPAEPRTRPARRRRPSGAWVVAAFVAVALLIVLSTRDDGGGPVSSYPAGAPVAAEDRYGAVVPGSVALAVDDVPDPDGGPRWGLRTFATTRGYGCLQVGRVQDGRLGVLASAARGGGDDATPARFHPLPSAPAAQATTCVPQDGAGAAFVATHTIMTTAATPAACWYASAGATRLRCSPATTRTVDAGLLGPRARAIMARVDGRARRVPTRGRGGAYLVVQRPVRPSTLPQTLSGHTYALPDEAPLAQTPASNVIATVSYAGAPDCAAHPTLSPRGSCSPVPGLTAIPQPAAETTRAPVAIEPAAADPGGGVVVTFTAPLAARDNRSEYHATITGPHARRVEATLATAVAAGTPIVRHLALPPGRYRVDVRYRVRTPIPRPTSGLDAPGYPVGHGTVRVR